MYNLNLYSLLFHRFLAHHFHKFEIGWCPHPFCYVAKMATVEGEKCQVYKKQRFDYFEYNIWVLGSALHFAVLEHTFALKIASVSTEVCELRHSICMIPLWLKLWKLFKL